MEAILKFTEGDGRVKSAVEYTPELNPLRIDLPASHNLAMRLNHVISLITEDQWSEFEEGGELILRLPRIR